VNEFDTALREGFELTLKVAGEERQFALFNAQGQRTTVSLTVIWSTESLKEIPLRAAEGGIYYEGDVLLSLRKKDLDGLPKPTLKLESPPGTVWHITDVNEDFGVYFLKLVKNRS
jgi:hypothetical protein